MQDIDREYISISEFARETGRSRTTVYKYLDSFLSTYVQQDAQGKKVISRAAVKAFESIEAGKAVQDGRIDGRTEKRSDAQVNEQVEQVIEALKEQLRVKDEQISSLHELLSESQAALSRQQQLAALQEQRIIQLTAADPETATTVEHEAPEDQTAAEQQKKGLFRRILEALTAD